MAIWQYDVHLLPAAAAVQHYGAMPVHISDAEFDKVSLWKGHPDSVPTDETLAKLLPGLASWNDQVKRWGFEDGNRIDVLSGGDGLDDILVRFDVRNISANFVVELLKMARELRLVVRLPCGSLIPPSPRRLLESIKASDAYKFVADPDAFLRTLHAQADIEWPQGGQRQQ
jgi:hypothetical protein